MYESVTNSTSLASLYIRYPMCTNLSTSDHPVYVVVNAAMAFPEEKAALLNMIFGVSEWTALLIHALAVEIYLNTTRDEGERLKKVSLMRRRAAGFE